MRFVVVAAILKRALPVGVGSVSVSPTLRVAFCCDLL